MFTSSLNACAGFSIEHGRITDSLRLSVTLGILEPVIAEPGYFDSEPFFCPATVNSYGIYKGQYSGYVEIPVTFNFSALQRDHIFYGDFAIMIQLTGSMPYRGEAGTEQKLYYRFGTPATLDSYSNFFVNSSYYGTDDSFNGGLVSFVPSGAIGDSPETVDFKQRFRIWCTARNMVVPHTVPETEVRYSFLVRVPFDVSLSGGNSSGTTISIPNFECSVWSTSNGIYYSDDPTDVSLGSTADGGVSQIVGSVDRLKEQTQKDAEQAHKDAEQAHEDSKNIFDKIADFFGSFFDNLINAVIGLFVPSDDDLAVFMDEMKSFLTDKLGFLGYPFELFAKLIALIAKEGDAVLTLPGFSIMGFVIWKDTTFDLSALMSNFPGLCESVQLGTSVIIIGAFLLYCQKKFNDVLGGASE